MSFLGKDIKKLGFGLMRLPKIGDEIDIEQGKKMVDLFMEAGFTYFDTAWCYEGSEEAAKKILVDRYPRESYQLATKLSAWADCKDKEHAISQFDVSLERTGAGYFDFYLLHNFGGPRSHFYDDFDLWNWVIEKKKEGKIKHIGLSTHGTAEELDQLLTAHPEMEFVQLQINYVDWDDPVNQSRECYEVAKKHNVPVIIMEPVKGGLLAKPPKSVEQIFAENEPDSTPASWAVRYAADLDNVITVLSGMSSIEQMQDNLATMKDFNGFDDEKRAVIARAQEEFKKIPIVPCTSCNYCAKVCPMGIGISGSFAAINELHQFDNLASAKNTANWLVGEQGFRPAAECIKCGKCEEACPQKIEIVKELENVVEVLG
ncbi:MAG: aldo/keto reductase [Emergencia sp.]